MKSRLLFEDTELFYKGGFYTDVFMLLVSYRFWMLL